MRKFGLTLIALSILIFALVALIPSEPKAETPKANLSLEMTGSKQIADFHRYYFTATNRDASTFTGKLNIKLVDKAGKEIAFQAFEAERPVAANGTFGVFVDCQMAPAGNGEYGVDSFKFTATP